MGHDGRVRACAAGAEIRAGGSFYPTPGADPFPLVAVAFGLLVAGLGAAGCIYLFFEYRRITSRDARDATARSTALARR